VAEFYLIIAFLNVLNFNFDKFPEARLYLQAFVSFNSDFE
jgi:hypothetical protein